MSVLKYLDPVSKTYITKGAVKHVTIVEGGTVEQLTASSYPNYVQPEVIEIVNKINSVRKDDSIVFIGMSDSHYPATQTATSAYEFNKKSSLQANQAAKVLSYLVKPDFFAHLGDISSGASSTTPDMLKLQIEEFIGMFREAKSDLPVFLCIGNHDGGIYYHDANKADGNKYTMTGEYLYDTFTSHSDSIYTVMGDASNGGYCYRDFSNKKLRVFMLNTSEGIVFRQTDSCTLASQRLWFANALLDLNAKSDASEWGIIVLCHYPADYGGTMPLSELFKAYVTGSSITITGNSDEGFASTAVSFAGKNNAKFIAQFHGHVHNFKTDKLYSYATGSGVQYGAHRVCIPNVQYDRENYYTTVGNYTDINFSESVSYNKVANTAEGTSFVVNVINPSEEKLYSFCYGAGYDRVVGFGSVNYYSISRSLTNVTTDNDAVSVEEGKSHSEIITLDSGADMKTITVTMGGIDISSTAVSIVDGAYHITISEVTGNVAITVKATLRPNFTNLVPLSISADGSDFNVDGDGYDNGVYITASDTLGSMANFTTTGFIPVKTGAKTIRVAGDGIDIDTTYTRFAYYDADFNLIVNLPYSVFGNGSYNGLLTEEDSTVITYTLESHTNGVNGVYLRVCTKGDGANLIVTVDEEITYGGNDSTTDVTYGIVTNLTRVSSSNTDTTVASGSSYYTTLTANSGYELGSVTVTMGGIDVTASVYSNGVISISNVTGIIVITASAISTSAYTNLIPLATTEWNGTEIYNSPYGYETGHRISTSTGAIQEAAGMCCTGYIPAVLSPGDVIRIKNITVLGTKVAALFFYNNNGTHCDTISEEVLTTGGSSANGFFTVTIADDGVIEMVVSGIKNVTAMRLSVGVISDESIITINEEIK